MLKHILIFKCLLSKVNMLKHLLIFLCLLSEVKLFKASTYFYMSTIWSEHFLNIQLYLYVYFWRKNYTYIFLCLLFKVNRWIKSTDTEETFIYKFLSFNMTKCTFHGVFIESWAGLRAGTDGQHKPPAGGEQVRVYS